MGGLEGWPWPEEEQSHWRGEYLMVGAKVGLGIALWPLFFAIAVPMELSRAGWSYARHVVCRVLDPARWP